MQQSVELELAPYVRGSFESQLNWRISSLFSFQRICMTPQLGCMSFLGLNFPEAHWPIHANVSRRPTPTLGLVVADGTIHR
jgi:hypothetical protein